MRAHSNKVTAVAAVEVSDVEVVLSGGRDKVAIAWSVDRKAVVRKQKLPGEVTALVACPHDPNKVIVALTSGSCVVWDWARGVHIARTCVINSDYAVTYQPLSCLCTASGVP